MKTYLELTHQQLLQLHEWAQGGNYTRMNGQIDQFEGPLIRIKTGHYITVLDVATGDITCEMLGRTMPVYNLFKIVALCRNWGLNYDKV